MAAVGVVFLSLLEEEGDESVRKDEMFSGVA